ncbi:unnamed protein product, partial [marine sediment metagenome]
PPEMSGAGAASAPPGSRAPAELTTIVRTMVAAMAAGHGKGVGQ